MVGTKDRIIGASAELLRRQGYEATGIKEIVAAAQAPFGSIYHFFPGGKEQLGAEAIRWSGAEYAKILPAVLAGSSDLISGMANFFAGAAEHLVETDYADACPIATVALEVSSRREILRQACADVFVSWVDDGTRCFMDFGLPETTARRLTFEAIAALEGAFILCRATRSTEALEVAGAALAASAEAALRATRKRRR